MTKKLENAKGLYLEGIREGKIAQALDKYIGDRYIQHSTGVADGKEGFTEFFDGFLKRTDSRDISIVRAIEDGRYVFLHVYQDIDHGTAKWVTTDMFDTDDNERVIEHWDVIAPYNEPYETESGNDTVLGEFELRDLDKTEENKALIRSFLVDVFQNKNHENLGKYVSDEEYIQHNPDMTNGIEALVRFLENVDFTYDFIFKVIGQGNHVVSYSKATLSGEELAVFDLFRIEGGKIVEHWDNMEQIPDHEELMNVGKF